MAITTNPYMRSASGTIDGIVYKKYYDKTVMSKKPDMSKRILSEKQMEANQRMKMANVYAKIMYGSDVSKMEARIRLKVPMHKSLFHALVKEHLDNNRELPIDTVEKQINKML